MGAKIALKSSTGARWEPGGTPTSCKGTPPGTKASKKLKNQLKTEQILAARKIVDQIHISQNIQQYIVSLVCSTREPDKYGLKDLKSLIKYGASPRATIFLSIAAKSHAFLNKRGFVIPEDVRSVGQSILRHRIILSYEAEAEDITTDNIIQRIYETVPTP